MIRQLDQHLLKPSETQAYLRRLGLKGEAQGVTEITGGVSSNVLSVDIGNEHVIVKQALATLKVRDQWTASRQRAITEATVLQKIAAATPEAVPTVLATDPGRFVTVMRRAPDSWKPWKQALFDGQIDDAVGARLGSLLASWQQVRVDFTASGVDPRPAFHELRIDPFYRTVAQRHPEDAALIGQFSDQLEVRDDCLVHGDFSPKNILVSADGSPPLWVLDWEVAHNGDPAFDIAFLLCHLLLKSVARPRLSTRIRELAGSFASAYDQQSMRSASWTYVFGHVGCLLLARVDGKSPAEYLSDTERAAVRLLGRTLLRHPAATVGEAWDVLAAQILRDRGNHA